MCTKAEGRVLTLSPQVVAAIKNQQGDRPLPDTELVQCIWQGLISSIEWSARQDQNDGLAIREITVRVASDSVAHMSH